MAIPTAPFLSFAASGQIAKTLVAANWKGRPYLRRYVIPSNPNTAAQQSTRNTFSWGNAVWKISPTLFQAPWDAFAQGQVLTGRNAMLSSVVSNLRGDVDLADFVFSPGAKSGLAAASMAVTPGVGTLTVDITAPALPAGWTIVQGIAAAIEDQSPETGTLYTMTAGFDATDPYSVVLAGLNTNLYYVGAWFEFTKPDGSTAYGPSIHDSDTPT